MRAIQELGSRLSCVGSKTGARSGRRRSRSPSDSMRDTKIESRTKSYSLLDAKCVRVCVFDLAMELVCAGAHGVGLS